MHILGQQEKKKERKKNAELCDAVEAWEVERNPCLPLRIDSVLRHLIHALEMSRKKRSKDISLFHVRVTNC